MRGADKAACQAATILLLLALTAAPAKAQFGSGAGGEDMMTQMAPMLDLMKAKMGKRRFGMLMQTVGPMMSRMMENGGGFGGIGGGFGGVSGYTPETPAISGGYGGGDMTGMLGGAGGGEIMAMIPQLMQLANSGGGHRRHRRH